MSEVITEVEKYRRGWRGGLPETPCGYGSRIDQTAIQRQWIAEIVAKYDIRSIVDVGAGDLNWVQLIEWPHPIQYRAYDLVPRKPGVYRFDLVRQIPPPADCVMCLWVLNHMPEDHARLALQNLRASGSKYLMLTWWPAMTDFLDIEPLESEIIRPRIQADIRLCRC